ncbi:MAG: class I SAM-dependent methyltransferase [Planctomycetaceae bacterium]
MVLTLSAQQQSDACRCRSCGHRGLIPVLSLGTTPLANALIAEDQLDDPEACWPLDLVRCGHCSLVQITATVPPEQLFSQYSYFSSFSDTMVSHAQHLVGRLIDERQLSADSLAVEIASNDGYLLQWYQRHGVPVLGIEPAANIADVAVRDRGVRTIAEFFGPQLATTLAADGGKADVIHANNVLAHVADLNGVVAGIATLLKPEGCAVIEVPYLGSLICHTEFDTIYHEHLCYFSLTALCRLFARHELQISDVERLDIHGGSLRIFATHFGDREPSAEVTSLLREESFWIFSDMHYARFGDRVAALRRSLTHELATLKQNGHRIAAYGASAKGSTLLNFFGIGAETIEFVVDRSPYKQGRYTPGTRLKIYAPEHLTENHPDYCLLLTWNFAEEIMRQQKAYSDHGGRFIIPIPDVRVA